MRSLADPEDVAAITGQDITGDDYVRVARLLEYASASVRSYCRQRFDLVADDLIRLTQRDVEGDEWGARITLPERTIVSVASVVVGGSPLDVASYAVDGDGLMIRAWPSLRPFFSSLWGLARVALDVTYTHGYVEIPDEIVFVTASLAGEQWRTSKANPDGVRAEGIGTYNVQYYARMAATAFSLSDPEKEMLNRYRRRTASPRMVIG